MTSKPLKSLQLKLIQNIFVFLFVKFLNSMYMYNCVTLYLVPATRKGLVLATLHDPLSNLPVSLSFGCYDKILLSGCLINNKYLFPIVLEAEKATVKFLAYSESDKGVLPGSQVGPSHVLTWQERQDSSGTFFMRALISLLRALLS